MVPADWERRPLAALEDFNRHLMEPLISPNGFEPD